MLYRIARGRAPILHLRNPPIPFTPIDLYSIYSIHLIASTIHNQQWQEADIIVSDIF
jgi:hypothetical protein